MTQRDTHVLRRAAHRDLPLAVSGDGATVTDAEGRRYLDGSAGVFVAILGHSATEVAMSIAAQVMQLNFAYSGDFTSAATERLSRDLVDLAPDGMAKVMLTTSGSTANEAALKLARQYHLARGNAEKTRIVSRWHSYHGSTIGALSMTGSGPRRRPYQPYLLDVAHVTPPYCYRCPYGLAPDGCGMACADEIEAVVQRIGPQYMSAVIVEPIAGAPLGALVTPPDYLRRVREICDHYDMVMIVDEIVSGLGRSGTWFAIEESGVVPDVITLAKGLGAGFVPIGAMVVHERIAAAFEAHGTPFVHSESFTGHVLLGTAGAAVIDYIRSHHLLDRVAAMGARLAAGLEPLADHPLVGEVRGRGLLFGLELVSDKATKAPFARAERIGERVVEAARDRGVLLLSGNAAANGIDGDTIVLAPPYVIEAEEIDLMLAVLTDALDTVATTMR